MSCTGSDEQQSVFTGALDEFKIHCPNCSHQFTLSEGLLMDENEKRDNALSEGADTAQGSMESLVMDAGLTAGKETLLKVASGSCIPVPTGSSGAAATRADNSDDNEDVDPAVAAGDNPEGANGDDANSSQPVSRCYQIINWTVEELEKVICDPNDRRIRKISSISQCDIEVRSEMAPTKFGAPKNFCILRAGQSVNIDQCRGLLKRQLLWVMRPRAQEADSPSATR